MVNCPVFNGPHWQLLLEKHNGNWITAMQEYRDLGDTYPVDILDKVDQDSDKYDNTYEANPHLADRLNVLKEAIVQIKLKIKKLSAIKDKTKFVRSNLSELQKALKKMLEYDAESALYEFINAADKNTKSILNIIAGIEEGSLDLSPSLLKKIKDFNNAFSVINDIKEEFFESGTGGFRGPVNELMAEVINNRNYIHNKYIEYTRKYIADMWEGDFKKIEAWHKHKAEVEFNTKIAPHLKLNKVELNKARNNYIEDYMNNNSAEIKAETKMYIRQLLTTTEDVTGLSSWMVNPRDIKHNLIQKVIEILDEADFRVMEKTISVTNRFKKVYSDYIKVVGKKNDPKEQYEPLISLERVEGVKAGTHEYDHPDNIVPVLVYEGGLGIDKYNEIKHGKYKGTAVEEMYDLLVEVTKEKDKLVPKFAKLGYVLPKIHKQTLERFHSNGVIDTVKEGVLDIYKPRSFDTDIGDVDGRTENKENEDGYFRTMADENKEERQFVPIYFRSKMNSSEQSMDLPSLMIMDYHNALNFKEKTEAALVIDLIKDNVVESNIIQRQGMKKLLKIGSANELIAPKLGKGSNLYKVLENIIQNRLYNRSIEAEPGTAKIVQSIKSFVSHVNMMLNPLSAAANLAQGTVMSWIDSVGGSTGVFTIKNRVRAIKKYDSDIFGLMNDIGKMMPESKTGLLVLLFDAHSDWNPSSYKFIESSKIKRLANLGALHGLSKIAEYTVQTIAMYAVLDNIKVMDAQGRFLTKEGTTEDRSKAMSLDEAYSINKESGELELDKRVAKTEKTDDVSQKELTKIAKIVRSTNRKLYGNYSKINKSKFERTIIGNLVMHMRGWLVNGVMYHWQGIGQSLIKTEDLKLAHMNYNSETGKFEEGLYTTVVRFLASAIKDYKSYKMRTFGETWKKMTREEKANVRRTMAEFAAIITSLIISLMLIGGDDDDATTIFLAYTSRRLYSELFTYINASEAWRTLRSPAISLSYFENLTDFTFELLSAPVNILSGESAFEKYQRGDRKGELKIIRKLSKLFPVWNQFERNTKDALNFLVK